MGILIFHKYPHKIWGGAGGRGRGSYHNEVDFTGYILLLFLFSKKVSLKYNFGLQMFQLLGRNLFSNMMLIWLLQWN